MLQEYQVLNPKLDKFLPHLVSYLKPDDTVVDVGANVGDTLASMVEKNPYIYYISIEADDFFYSYLTKNISRMRQSVANLKIDTIKCLVGSKIFKATLSGNASTKHAVIGVEGSYNSQSLDKLLLRKKISNLRLLKSDVDGFDYDVLNSSMATIKKFSPLIFVECDYINEKQKNSYIETLKIIKKNNYNDWIIFDNFGEIVLRTTDFNLVIQLFDYVWRQKTKKGVATIYYFDILIAKKKESSFLNSVIRDYV